MRIKANVQASHSQFAEMTFVELLMCAFRKWKVTLDTPLESKLSPAYQA